MKYLWCLLFHRKYRKRTGTRRIMRVHISYDLVCAKCGIRDSEMIYTPIGTLHGRDEGREERPVE